jgi:hypothetical protein
MTTAEITTIQTATRELNLMLTIEDERIDTHVSSHIRNQIRLLEQLITPDRDCHICKGTGLTVISLAGDEIPGASMLTTDVCTCVGLTDTEAIPL